MEPSLWQTRPQKSTSIETVNALKRHAAKCYPRAIRKRGEKGNPFFKLYRTSTIHSKYDIKGLSDYDKLLQAYL